MLSAQRLAVALSLLTLGYLTLPVLIFLIGWLWWPWAITLSALTVAAFVILAKRILATPKLTGVFVDALVPWYVLLAALVPLTALTLISGVGGYGPGGNEWTRHHAILFDLVSQPWPVAYTLTDGGKAALVCNVAFFLPAAVAGKLWGWAAANHALLLTTLVGAWLVSLWLVVFCPRHVLTAVGVFTFFSGLDSLGFLLHAPSLHRVFELLRQGNLDTWTTLWQLPAHATGIFASPQYTFAAWLGTALLLHVYWRDCAYGAEFFVLALLLFWSPFVALGAIPFVWIVRAAWTAPALEKKKRKWKERLPHVAAILLALVAILFYAAHFPAIANDKFGVPQGFTSPANGFFFRGLAETDSGHWMLAWREYLLAAALEFGLLALVLLVNRHALVPRERRTLFACTLFPLLLMLFRFGHYNELATGASLPSLFVLSVLLVLALPQIRTPLARTTLALIFAFGLFTPILSIRSHLTALSQSPTLWRCPQPIHLTVAASHFRRDTPLVLSHYLARTEGFFFRVLSKPVHL